jgi:hypothetical protein
LIDQLNELNAKETSLEDFSAEVVTPALGKARFEITARKLLIPSGRSSMILVSFHRE